MSLRFYSSGFRVFAIVTALSSLGLAGCGGSQGQQVIPSGVSGSAQRPGTSVSTTFHRPQPTEEVLYSFMGGDDGQYPASSLRYIRGALYGTTESGGTSGYGTVFSVTTSGSEKVIHSFAGGHTDGIYPLAQLTNLGYGTTLFGGAHGLGIVYQILASDRERVVYDFESKEDGWAPAGRLIEVGGTLYGTTNLGGADHQGTVFSVTPDGTKTTVYSFRGGSDGAYPEAGLSMINGVLYGTTLHGGYHDNGTVFSLTTSGSETVLHRFTGGPRDGHHPVAGLVDVGGSLFGTTTDGGTAGFGTVFKCTRGGVETVLHSFLGARHDGAGPGSGHLIIVDNVLYGMTQFGGEHNYGTVYSIKPNGSDETVLHSFAGFEDGQYPYANLISRDGVLYGTTRFGGHHHKGTVFALTP